MIVKIAHYVLKFLKEQFKRLEKEQIFVYICHGNHDPLTTKLQIIGLIMYQYFQIVLKPIKRLPKLENKFIFMVLVIKTIQVMKIKLMNIHLVKEVMVYI